MLLMDYWSSTAAPSQPALDGQGAALPRAAEEVFYAFAPRVYNLARRLLGNEADAEDVTQEVLLQVVGKLDTFRGECCLTTWLHRVTVNAALHLRRRRARKPEVCLDDALGESAGAEAAAGPEQRALDREAQSQVERAIAGLPTIYRDVFVRAGIEGLPNPEIAELLGLRLGTVKSRMHRARLALRDALAPYFAEATA